MNSLFLRPHARSRIRSALKERGSRARAPDLTVTFGQVYTVIGLELNGVQESWELSGSCQPAVHIRLGCSKFY